LILNQTARHKGWIEQVRVLLDDYGLPVHVGLTKAGRVCIRGKTYQRAPGLSLRTTRSEFLGTQRARWYPAGKKRIPIDVSLSPTTLAHWYFGDGTVGCRGYHATFCTDGFPAKDVRRLMVRMRRELDLAPVLEQRNRILLCRTDDRRKLLEAVTVHTPTCFAYKLRLRTVDRRFTLSPEQLRAMRREGLGFHRIAKQLKVSKSGVAAACHRLGI